MLISAAMIVRDESAHLDDCLAALDGLVDEVVIVDTGSTDDSVARARRLGAVVDEQPWRDDFATPRNRSLDLATGEWILYVDADERVRGDRAAIRAALTASTDHAAFRVRFVPRVGWTPYREYRLWRRHHDIRFEHQIHETMVAAIRRVAAREQLLVGDLDLLTIEHLGYEGDQQAKHERNEPLLLASLEDQPDRPFVYDHLARIYEDQGDDARARQTWRSGMAIARARGTSHPDDQLLWSGLFVNALAHGDPDGDVTGLLDEVHERYPGNLVVEYATAAHELENGDPASAARRFERLLALDLEQVIDTNTAYDPRLFGEWSWNGLGLARLELDDAAGACDAFREAEAAAPDDPAYRTRRQLAEARAKGVS